jgi:hypothetical protein
MLEGLLRHRNARYLWVSLLLIVGCAVLYATQRGLRPAGGGTWQGYALGTIGALMIVWLAWLGIRKRRYSSTEGTLAGWTSAHVYLGMALLAVATLHCAAKFGWNVHTLAYVLMCAVVSSGMFGVYAYSIFPQKLSQNRAGGSRAKLFAELYALDNEGRGVARHCSASVNTAIKSSIERTAIGGGVVNQLLGRDRSLFVLDDADDESVKKGLANNTDQQGVISYVSNRIPRAQKGLEAASLQSLVLILCRRQAVLRRIRRDIQLNAWLKLWLYVHVPLTVALLVALSIHILTTFLYW